MVRRFLVVLAAVVLGASVLVVAGSPASAANTASEVLSDHDDDAATPVVREFAGANRYATSVALARAFVNSVGSGGFADSVIVASGVSVVDAAAAAGLAASKSAPVVLTTPNRLSRVVENFIVDEFISEVFIVGGLEAVSQSVEDALADLATVRTVTRLSGPDRYATSVALAEEMGTPGVYCDSGEVTAILVNVDDSFADVIAVGPLAYALELPVLLTRANALPDVVSGYLVDAEVERVVIVGGETAVSAEVVSQLTDVGVTNVARISGANRYSTALAILEALEDCATITVSSSPAALINGDSPADGVAAGPLLGSSGLSGDAGVTPVLLVQTDQLPAETRDYLASIPLRNRASQLIDQSIVAIGGTAVVSQAVMQAAINAAITSKPLTATITAIPSNPGVVKIKFSSNVELATAGTAGYASSALNRAFYTVSGGPLFSGDMVARVSDEDARSVVITLPDPLRAGDVISIAGGKISGAIASGDKRLVGATTFTVVTPVPDKLRPSVQITAADGAHEFAITVNEKNDRSNEKIEVTEVTWKGVALPATAGIYYQGRHASDLAIVCLNGVQNQEYIATSPTNSAVNANVHDRFVDTCKTTPDLGAAQTLATGDVIAVEAEAVADVQGNTNRSTRARVTSNEKHPTLVSASVSNPTVVTNASVSWTVEDPAYVEAQGRRLTSEPLMSGTGEPYHVFLHEDSTHFGYWTADTLDYCKSTGRSIAEGTSQISYDVREEEYNALDDTTTVSTVTYPLGNRVVTESTNTWSGHTVTRHNNGVIILYILHDCDAASYINDPSIISALPNYELKIAARADNDIADIREAVTDHTVNPFGYYSAGAIGVTSPYANPFTYVTIYDDIPGNFDGSVDTEAEKSNDPDGGVSANFKILSESDVLSNGLTVTITANKDGIAAGAAGNDWKVNWSNLGAAADADTDPSASVNIINERSVINIVFEDGATFADILTAANSNVEFTRNFTMDMDTSIPISNDPAAPIQITGPVVISGLTTQASTTERLTGGESHVTLTLQYNDVLKSFDAATFISNQRILASVGSVRYYRQHGTKGENVSADYVATGEETLVPYSHASNPLLCTYDSTIAAAVQAAMAGPTDCRFDTRGINMNSRIVLTLTSHGRIPKRGQTLTLANSIAKNYRHDVTATDDVTTNADSITTRYGASLPNTKVLRSG